MKYLLLFLLLPCFASSQRSLLIKVPGARGSTFDSTSISNRIDLKLNTADTASMLNPYRKAYYTIDPAPDSSYVTITSIDGTQTDTISFTGGTGVIESGIPKLDVRIVGTPQGLLYIPGATIAKVYEGSNIMNLIAATSNFRYFEKDSIGVGIDTIVFNNLESDEFKIQYEESKYVARSTVLFPKLKYQVNLQTGGAGSNMSFIVKNLIFDSLKILNYITLTMTDSLCNSFPSLEYSGSVTISGDFLTSVFLPKLKGIDIGPSGFGLQIANSPLLKRIIAPNCGSAINSINIGNNPNLTDIQLSSVIYSQSAGGFSAYFNNNALSQQTVDNILIAIDNGGSTGGGYLELSGGTNSTPSLAGLTAKANLISKGWTVLTN